MALMFPRLARNFAKNGYYPTDEVTLERVIQFLAPAPESSPMRILDPCAGEGTALAEVAHALGRDQVQASAVEYDFERATHARSILDHVLHSDLMDTMISRQAFGLLWLNPPYGDLVADHSGASRYQGKGRRRLEKAFYQRSLPLLQYGGVLVLIVPRYVLDDEFSSWLSNHFTNLQIFSAADVQFKQVVILGVRIRRQDLDRPSHAAKSRELLGAIGRGEVVAPMIPAESPSDQYIVAAAVNELDHFYRLSLEPEQFSHEIERLRGHWSEFDLHFGQQGQKPRSPVTALSQWHLALALAAGAISGVVTSRTGRVLALKGDTYKEKARKTEFSEDGDGNISEVRILTDRFVPVIRAWDMTPSSPTLGRVLTITSSASTPAPETLNGDALLVTNGAAITFPLGNVVCTQGVQHLMETCGLDLRIYLQRHAAGDWGELDLSDKNANNNALLQGDRLLSAYEIGMDGTSRIWIITEADRSVTTLLLPSEY